MNPLPVFAPRSLALLLFAGLPVFARVGVAQTAGPGPTPTPTPSVPPAVHVYGWVQLGFAADFASPRDRINFGANLDWRSNDYRLNQVYFVCENPLEHEG